MDIQGLLVAFITNVSLILVSIIIIIWVVSLYFKKKSKKWYHFIMLIGAVVTIVLCMRAIKANYDYYDKWNHYCPLKIANSSLKLLNYSLLLEIFLRNDLKS